jgi:cobalamin biosynthesis protein CbiG
VTYDAGQLANVPVPTPSANVHRLVGVPSVAEAAAMLAAGGELIVRKTKAPAITVAVARIAND